MEHIIESVTQSGPIVIHIPLEAFTERLDIIEETLFDIIKKLEEISNDSIHDRFKLSWDILMTQDEKIIDNSIRINNMINEFKGFIAMTRAEFSNNKKLKD